MSKDKRERSYTFTLNNYTDEDIAAYKALYEDHTIRYLVFGKEKGQSGTPHLQGLVVFWDGKTKSAIQKKLNGRAGHLETKRGTFAQAANYCKKGEQTHEEWEKYGTRHENYGKNADVTELGTLPMDHDEKGELGKRAAKERWELAKRGRFEELPPEQIRTYEYIYNKYNTPDDRNHLTNFWIYGASEVGKSKGVRAKFKNVYAKNKTEWWDHYRHEVVLVEDINPMDAEHIRYLERYFLDWADHYVFNAQVKGGTIKIRPPIICVTSNYSLDEVLDLDNKPPDIAHRWRRRFIQLKATEHGIPWDTLPDATRAIVDAFCTPALHTGVGGNNEPPPDEEELEEQVDF